MSSIEATTASSPGMTQEEMAQLFQEVVQDPGLVGHTLDSLKQVKAAMERKLEEAHRQDEIKHVDQWLQNYYEPVMAQVQEMKQLGEEVERLALRLEARAASSQAPYVPTTLDIPGKQHELQQAMRVVGTVKKNLQRYAQLAGTRKS
jgi:hypothetical protein